MALLRIVRGMPGSGKTTLCKTFKSIHIDLDDLHTTHGFYHWNRNRVDEVNQVVTNVIKELVKLDCDILISDVFPKLESFTPFIDIAKSAGYSILVIKLTGNHGSIHDVNPDDIEYMKSNWEDYSGEIKFDRRS